jgi:hypothetical protein
MSKGKSANNLNVIAKNEVMYISLRNKTAL